MAYQPLPAPQYPPGYFVPPPKRPPLTRPLRRSAAAAGLVGFGLISLGWTLAAAAVTVALIAGLLAWLFGTSGVYGSGNPFGGPDAGLWIAGLVGGVVVGILLWIGGLFASRGILARAGHPKPWGVTWAALGIAVAATWVVSTVGSVVAQFASVLPTIGLASGGGLYDPDGAGDILGWLLSGAALWAVLLLVGVAGTLVTGWLSWWWMAHAMRPAAPVPGTLSAAADPIRF